MHTVVRDLTPWLATRNGSILDVGCGDQPYRKLLGKGCEYFGLDWEGSRTGFAMTEAKDVTYFDGGIFPFADRSFDSVLHTEVLEHVKNIDLFLKECHRILRPGGELGFTVPFQARYHFIPFDYWRFTPSGLTEILERSGFSKLEISPRGSDITVAAYKVVGVFFRLALDGLAGKVLFVLFSWLVVLLLLIAHVSLIFDMGSSDDCLGYTVMANRPLE